MANKIVLKKSSVPSKVPQTTDLDYGELALNYSDGRLYYKTASNTIDFFQSSFDIDSFKTISVDNQQSIVADGPLSTLSFVAGDGITITTNPTTSSLTISSQQTDNVTLGVDARSGLITSVLSPLLQTFLQFDGVTFRTNQATVLTRDGSVAVIA